MQLMNYRAVIENCAIFNAFKIARRARLGRYADCLLFKLRSAGVVSPLKVIGALAVLAGAWIAYSMSALHAMAVKLVLLKLINMLC